MQIITPTGSGSGFRGIRRRAGGYQCPRGGRAFVGDSALGVGRELRRAGGGPGDALVDLAALRVESGATLPPMPLGGTRPPCGWATRLSPWGFPLKRRVGAGGYTVTTGIVSARRTYGAVETNPDRRGHQPRQQRRAAGEPETAKSSASNTSTYAEYAGISFAISVSEVKTKPDQPWRPGVSVKAESGGGMVKLTKARNAVTRCWWHPKLGSGPGRRRVPRQF